MAELPLIHLLYATAKKVTSSILFTHISQSPKPLQRLKQSLSVSRTSPRMDKLPLPSDDADVDKVLEKGRLSPCLAEEEEEDPRNKPPHDLLLDKVVKLVVDSLLPPRSPATDAVTEVVAAGRPPPPSPPPPPPLRRKEPESSKVETDPRSWRL